MQFKQSASGRARAPVPFPGLVPVDDPKIGIRQGRVEVVTKPSYGGLFSNRTGRINTSVLSFQNMHTFGDLFVCFLRARKRTFIDQLQWSLPEADGMEFDQYDTPLSRWIVIHEFGEVLGGIRLTPTVARCGIYSYMLRDAQRGLLDEIPTDVLFFEAPVSKTIWEASRLFISDAVPGHRRLQIQMHIMEALSDSAKNLGASQVIGIVPAVWSRWLRRLDLNAIPVGPKFRIDDTVSQAALFNTSRGIERQN